MNDVLRGLQETFGYVPEEDKGEKWAVYNNCLIVIHPMQRPRIYRRGCKGIYFELEPDWV